MRVCSKSGQEIQDDCATWAKEIEKSYSPELIIFIAKSGFLFARPLAKVFHCDMADLVASRPANNAKNWLKPIIKFVPSKIILALLSSPVMYRFNEKKNTRDITITSSYEAVKRNTYGKILVVDDSVDTGWTIRAVQKIIECDFPEATIKIACYSVIDSSKKRVKVDFWRYENAVILTATSRKSAEYHDYLEEYTAWSQSNGTGVQDGC